MPKLTKRVVDSAEIRPKPYFIPCSDLSGFNLRVFPSGRKSYVVDYYADGKRHKMTLGRHGVLTVDQARSLAIQRLADVTHGKNPMLERQNRREAMTVRQLCDDYFTAADEGRVKGRGGKPKKPSTLANDRSRVDRHVLPLVGDRKVRDLRPVDIAKLRDDITAGRTARVTKAGGRGRSDVTGGEAVATRTIRTLGGIMTYGVQIGQTDASPTRGVPLAQDSAREQRLTPDQYALFGRALDTAEEWRMDWRHVACARLLALTGWRLGEAQSLEWSILDLEARVADFADTKSGRSIRPIALPVVALLESLDRTGRYVFPSPKEREDGTEDHYAGMDDGLDRIIPLEPGIVRFTAQVLRHSFNSVGFDLGIPKDLRKMVVGQRVTGDVNDGYTHALDSTLIDAADKISGEVMRQMRCL